MHCILHTPPQIRILMLSAPVLLESVLGAKLQTAQRARMHKLPDKVLGLDVVLDVVLPFVAEGVADGAGVAPLIPPHIHHQVVKRGHL